MRTYLLRQVIYTGLAAGLLIMSEAKADVNIAVIAPQAGESQAFGEELISGVKIAVEGINAQGGLNGEKINLITVDDRCDDRLAVSTAQMMAVNTSQTDKISMVIGPYCSNAFDEVAGIYAKAKIFQIMPTALSSQSSGEGYQGLVKMAGYKDRQSVDFYNFYSRRYPDARVAIVYDSNDREIVEIAASLQQEFKKHNKLDKLQAFSYTSYEDADDLAEAVAEAGIRVAYILGSPTQSAEMAKLLKSEDEKFAIFVSKYKAQEDYDVIFTGAGTSEFVGNALYSYINRLCNYKAKSYGTTDITATPENYISPNKPTLLISFGRSGNSPESIGAVDSAEAVSNNLYHLFVTCNKNGALSKRAEKEANCLAINLTDETHDQSFAMTSSFSNMYLATLLCFSIDNLEETIAKVNSLIEKATELVDKRYVEMKEVVDSYNFNRIVYLGSNTLKGIAQESALKMLELIHIFSLFQFLLY